MNGNGRALKYIFCERLWRSANTGNIYLRRYDSVMQLQAGLTHYFDCYDHEKPHQSLNYRTPALVRAGRIRLDAPYLSRFVVQ